VDRSWHPGWSGWFTWGGYRGRLSYLGASMLVGLCIGLVAGAFAAVAALVGIGAGQGWTPLAAVGAAGVALAVLAAIVAFLCIMAQRMRDIGMPVVPCLVAYGLGTAVASAGVAVQGTAESAALWNTGYPLWLNLLQLGLTVFAIALLIVPGNAWLDAE
jgi:uncharacterized membrane protein YhaH (DUF805 family)